MSTKPFLKWAGGKTRLLPELVKRMPEQYNTYFEPFLGGGALFFHLQPQRAQLSDANSELINAYRMVRDWSPQLCDYLANHQNTKEYYDHIRNIDRTAEYQHWGSMQKASRFIYLNKTCFNGLYRVNAKGQFNVPFGNYKNPCVLDTEVLQKCSLALDKARLFHCDFDEIETLTQAGDFVYMDPPYVPLSTTSSFTGYTKDGFGFHEHRRLKKLCNRLDARGVQFMLSNSATNSVKGIFAKYRVETITVPRSISASADSRKDVQEVIVRNY
jgi:DNA adenine methylase